MGQGQTLRDRNEGHREHCSFYSLLHVFLTRGRLKERSMGIGFDRAVSVDGI